MTYEVILTERAVADIDETIAYYIKHATPVAARWCSAVEQAIDRLEGGALGFAAAREASLARANLKQINFGVRRRLTHRMVFVEREDRLVVYTVRHLAQQDITLDDIA